MTRLQKHQRKSRQNRDLAYILFILFFIITFSRAYFKDTPVKVVRQPEIITKEVIKPDQRGAALEKLLESKGSPLAPYASTIIKASDDNGIDWTLITAIAGKESGFGKNIRSGSFNAWGIGGRKPYYFNSWEEAIDYEAQLLGQAYRANAVAGIQYKYCPSFECSDTWTADVVSFSQEILASR